MDELNYHVSVSLDHIEHGITNDPTECPVAIALKYAGIPYPVVENDSVIYNEYTKSDNTIIRYTATLPFPAQMFIIAFDCHEEVHPLEFDLEFIENAE